ncbi:MAG TPA: hypothetical protein VIG33_01715 [Pseudobdellovibrionaceae bacterium]
MKTTEILFTALTSLMLLTTACGNTSNGGDPVAAAAPAAATGTDGCINCTGFVAGPPVFSGNVSGGGFRIDNLTVIADQNSLDTAAAQSPGSSPRMSGTYQGMVTGGTFTASGSTCVADGTYQVSGLQVGMISTNLSTQSVSPMWVTLKGPSTIRAPIYIKLADTNNDDIGDSGTVVYLWFYCSGWNSIGMSAQ